MKIAYKIWLEKNGQPVFGKGIHRLLSLVRETGSLHKAAERLDMSYRAAWGKVRTFEKTLNVDILERGRHGRTGAHLTETGEAMLLAYERIQQEMEALINDGPLSTIAAELETLTGGKREQQAVSGRLIKK